MIGTFSNRDVLSYEIYRDGTLVDQTFGDQTFSDLMFCDVTCCK